MTTSALSPSRIRHANEMLSMFAREWRGEIPLRINDPVTDAGHGLGGPRFHADFMRFIGYVEHTRTPECASQGCGRDRHRDDAGRNSDSRTRTTRVFRKIRRVAPREFDVLYMLCVLGFSVDEIAVALSDKAIRRGDPERYNRTGVMLLAVSGVDKATSWY